MKIQKFPKEIYKVVLWLRLEECVTIGFLTVLINDTNFSFCFFVSVVKKSELSNNNFERLNTILGYGIITV